MNGFRPSDLFTGRLLVTVGVTMVLVAGPCSLYAFQSFGGTELWTDPAKFGSFILIMISIVGGVPSLLGVLLIHIGRKRLRRSKIKSKPQENRR